MQYLNQIYYGLELNPNFLILLVCIGNDKWLDLHLVWLYSQTNPIVRSMNTTSNDIDECSVRKSSTLSFITHSCY